jgi:hypothetical protein
VPDGASAQVQDRADGLGDMRQHGEAMCHGCRHEVIVNVDKYPEASCATLRMTSYPLRKSRPVPSASGVVSIVSTTWSRPDRSGARVSSARWPLVAAGGD